MRKILLSLILLTTVTSLFGSTEIEDKKIVVKYDKSIVGQDGSTKFDYPYYSAGVENYRFGWSAGTEGAIGICKALGFENYLIGSATGFDWQKFRRLAYLDTNGNLLEIDDRESVYFKEIACFNGEYRNITKSYERKEFPNMIWFKIPTLQRGTEEKRFSIKSNLNGICKLFGLGDYVAGSGIYITYGSTLHLAIINESGELDSFQSHSKYVNEISCYKE